jgi:hypothetical protein
MGLAAWLDLDGRDIAAFVVAGLLGYGAGRLVPAGWWAIYTSILVSYHLFLAWLVLSADQKAGLSLPIVSTIATHLACLTIVVALGLGRHLSPLFGLLRYGIAALAIFERGWLFSELSSKPKRVEDASAGPVITATAEDEQAWHRYLSQRKPGALKPGLSLRTEYEQWMLAREQSRSAAGAKDGDARVR